MCKVAAAIKMCTMFSNAMAGTIPTETNATRGPTIRHSNRDAYTAVKPIIPRRDVDGRMQCVIIARRKDTCNQCVLSRDDIDNNNIEEAGMSTTYKKLTTTRQHYRRSTRETTHPNTLTTATTMGNNRYNILILDITIM